MMLPKMPALLERTGCTLRARSRATCPRCHGRDRRTIAFNDEVAVCHRCHWSANRITLAREFGLLTNDPAMRRRLHREQVERERLEAPIRAFEAWRERRMRMVADKYWEVACDALLAHFVLQKFPDCDAAWNALAEFAHAESKLLGALDWLSFAKVSPWLEADGTPMAVFSVWRLNAKTE